MGRKLDGDITPIEAGLDFATRKTRGFIGFEALQARSNAGAANKVISLVFGDDQAVPLDHEPICRDGRIIGQTSSCLFDYRIGKPVALGHVVTPQANGAKLQVDIAHVVGRHPHQRRIVRTGRNPDARLRMTGSLKPINQLLRGVVSLIDPIYPTKALSYHRL